MKKGKLFLVVLVALIVFVIAFGLFVQKSWFEPVLINTCRARVNNLAFRALNQAVMENAGLFHYEDLIKTMRDNNGNITMLQADSANMLLLSTKMGDSAQRIMASWGSSEISIPLGTIIGGPLFQGKGPRLSVTIEPIGSVSTNYVSSFESTGINQTLHKISLEMTASLLVVMPSQAVSVVTKVSSPIAESLIVGIVPETYVDVPRDEILNLVP